MRYGVTRQSNPLNIEGVYKKKGGLNMNMSSYKHIEIPMIRRPRDRLISNMVIPYLGKTVFILRRGPACNQLAGITAQITDVLTARVGS